MTTGLLKTSWQMGQMRCLCSIVTAGPPSALLLLLLPPSCMQLSSFASDMVQPSSRPAGIRVDSKTRTCVVRNLFFLMCQVVFLVLVIPSHPHQNTKACVAEHPEQKHTLPPSFRRPLGLKGLQSHQTSSWLEEEWAKAPPQRCERLLIRSFTYGQMGRVYFLRDKLNLHFAFAKCSFLPVYISVGKRV